MNDIRKEIRKLELANAKALFPDHKTRETSLCAEYDITPVIARRYMSAQTLASSIKTAGKVRLEAASRRAQAKTIGD